MRSLKFLRAWRVFLYAVFLINVGSLILNALVGTWFAILPAVMIVGTVAVIRLHAKTIARREYLDRPIPDYSLIAAMEQEIYGETFTHDGAAQPARPATVKPVRAVGGKMTTCARCGKAHVHSGGLCPRCYNTARREGSRYSSPNPHYPSPDNEYPANLRWERRS